MAVYVLDASLILANLNNERGGERLIEFIDDSVVSVVTYTEVVTKLIDQGMPFETAERSFEEFDLPRVPVTESLARRAAELRPSTRPYGLALGDRICLATAESLRATAVTADQAWQELASTMDIELIR
jgi:PIN domain nuclease of toxin-antitoxin system